MIKMFYVIFAVLCVWKIIIIFMAIETQNSIKIASYESKLMTHNKLLFQSVNK